MLKDIDASELLKKIDPKQYELAVKNNADQGTPLVSIEELSQTTQPLAVLARLLIINDNITKEKLDSLFEIMSQKNGWMMAKMTSDKGNLRKHIVQPQVSWNLLEKFIHICGYDIQDITLKLTHRDTGETKEFSRNDITKYVDNDFVPSITKVTMGD